MADDTLIGIGLYTPAEASRLIGVGAGRLVRWLRGHAIGNRLYPRLWQPQIDLGDGEVYLGFRDLMEARVADAFIRHGLSPQRVRCAIQLASTLLGEERPLSTTRFRTDGRTVFLELLEADGERRLIDLFRSQYTFRQIIEPSLRNVDYDESGLPLRWWPAGKSAHIVIDPGRCFGRPIDADSGVPISILAAAARAEGSIEAAARVWGVPVAAVRRATRYQGDAGQRQAA